MTPEPAGEHRDGPEGGERIIHVVPHTHWDREWYQPFERFRAKLVDLLDDLLPSLEADPGYTHFMLDGQMAVVDDYLAIRPEAEARLSRLAGSGRVGLGPWYVLMDEFLVSGETIIRDLQAGLARADDFGGAMEVGYLPDMFGHVAQMPQILAQFGFDHAVVWRGVPSAIDRDAFRWEAPDGSAVRAAYLATGYGNGALVPDDAKALVALIEDWCAGRGELAGDRVLWMNGTDHLRPQAHLPRVAAEVNDLDAGVRLEIGPLAEHLEALATREASEGTSATLPRWRGELRSGARANVLMGVASNRTDVRQAEARVTRALEQVAEPLCALYLEPGDTPTALLERAWGEVIRNSAHDSVCACSADEVGRAVLARYDTAAGIAGSLADRALAAIAAEAGIGDTVVVNPAGRARPGLVTRRVKGTVPENSQVLATRPGERTTWFGARDGIFQAALGALDALVDARAMAVTGDDGTLVATIICGDLPVAEGAETDLAAARATLATAARAGERSDPARVTVVDRERHTVLTAVDEVPGFGWRRLSAGTATPDPVTATAPTDGRGARLDNGTVTITVDATDATFSLDGVAGLGRLVDDGDRGDTYNWCPPGDDRVVDVPEAVEVSVAEAGPLRARLEVRATHHWPREVSDDSRDPAVVGTEAVEVTTTLELRAGEDLVRVSHELDNRCRDHRLRAHLPLPEPAARSSAECAFTAVSRGLTAEGGPSEVGLPTFPSRRWVRAGGLTVTHEGCNEYELVDITGAGDDQRAGTLALTLLRCTGVISQGPMPTRPQPAGPPVATTDAQMQGRQQIAYAVTTSERDPWAVADDAWLDLEVATVPGGRAGTAGTAVTPPPLASGVLTAAATGTPLEVHGARVSAVTRVGDALRVRVFNPNDEESWVSLPGRRGWLVDLRDRPVEAVETGFALGPHAIATVALSGDSSAPG